MSYDKAQELDCAHMFQEKDVKWVNKASLCHVTYGLINFYIEPGYYWLKTAAISLPVIWAFFLLDKPHDCFRCLGKDPDRIFSIS